jgi:hypothetical protein
VKANWSSGVMTAQQISLQPLPTDAVRGTQLPIGELTCTLRIRNKLLSKPSTIAYEDAAAAPFAARKASVTTRVPPEVNPNPYGVGPCDAIARVVPKVPLAATW